MEKITKIFYDLETTGLSYKMHSIHHISGMVEVNDEVVEKFDFKLRPHPKAVIDSYALKVGNVTEEIIAQYPEPERVLVEFKELLSRYCDKYDKSDKMYLVGYNNRKFDDFFLQMFFELYGDSISFLSYFWSHSIDVLVLASEYLQRRRPRMSSFKLHRVARELGIEIEEERLHTADYDVELTRKIYRIVTGRDYEI